MIIEAKKFNKAIDKLIPPAPNGGENSDMYEQVNTLLNDRSIEKSRAVINEKLNEIAPEVENVNESINDKEKVIINEFDDKNMKLYNTYFDNQSSKRVADYFKL